MTKAEKCLKMKKKVILLVLGLFVLLPSVFAEVSPRYVMPDDIKGNFLMEIGWHVYPSRPMVGLIITIVFIYGLLAASNVLPEMITNWYKEKKKRW